MHLCGRWPRKDFSTLVPPRGRDARILVALFVKFSFHQIIFNFDSAHRFFPFSSPYRPRSVCVSMKTGIATLPLHRSLFRFLHPWRRNL